MLILVSRIFSSERTLLRRLELRSEGADSVPTAAWYRNEILGSLDLWAANEPLLRAWDYRRWSKAVEGVLVALSFGIALAEVAPSTESREGFLRAIIPAMTEALLKMGPEIWHHFADSNDRLAKLTAFLGYYVDILGAEVNRLLSNLMMDDAVPGLWKLLLILQSASLTHNFAAQVRSMVTAPSTPACHRNLSSIHMWAKRILQAAQNLAKAHEDLRSFLEGVMQSVNDWRDSFPPMIQ
jgi:hypothetical protein